MTEIFCAVRRCYVRATPEERVRQALLTKMIDELGYPAELIAVEKELKELPHLSFAQVPDRRIDILCYGANIHPDYALYPLLLIECKEGKLGREATEQLVGYNRAVQASFLALASPLEVKWGYFNHTQGRFEFFSGLPAFKELMQWIKPSRTP